MRQFSFLLFLCCLINTCHANANLHLTPDDATVVPPIVVKKPKPSLTSGPSSAISSSDIQSSGMTSLGQVLQNLAGVQLQDLTGNGNQVLLSMRGFGANASSNTLFMINGIPIVNPDLAPPDLNAIPLNEITTISVIAGSESVLYGDQAVGGVININTKDVLDKKIQFTCIAGSYNQYNCAIDLNNQFKLLHYNFLIERNHTDNYREHNAYLQNLISTTLMYPITNGKLRLFVNAADENMQFPGALTAEQVREDRRQATNSIDFFKDNNAFLHAVWERSLNDQTTARIDLSRRQMNGNGILGVPFTQQRLTNYIRPQIKWSNDTLIAISGLELQQDDYELNSEFGDTDNNQQKYSGYGLLNLTLAKAWKISAGMRGAVQSDQLVSFANQSSINRAFVTSAGINYAWNDETSFYLRRAGSYRFPKADENATAPVGVSSLQTQRGVAYESGVDTAIYDVHLKASVYQLNLKDEIAFDPFQTPDQPFGSNQNLLPTVRRGLSISEQNNISESLTLSSQWNLVSAEFQNGLYAGKRIPLVSENIIHAGLNYQFKSFWNLYGEALFTGNQFAANDYANVGQELGGYTVYNVSVGYKLKALSVSLRLNNILNKYYYLYTVYQLDPVNQFYYPAAARNITLSISYEI